ncbi:hypothetical protein ABW21_db0209767 [Orbilia brochopaga]|nr:hypothetical protein ABW21_db0209767 [Drechslerella brochopaga]
MAAVSAIAAISPAADDDDLLVALAMQMDELQLTRESYKGKERLGEQPDGHVALDYFYDILSDVATFYSDQKMANSIANAVYQDAPAIQAFVAAENTATRDREQALRMENATAPATTTLDNDDTASVFTDYERYTTLPPHIFVSLSDEDDDVGESEAGPSTRPQAKALDCFAEQITCGVCNEHVSAGISVRCPCGHIYCRECLRRVASTAIKDESMYPLKCCRQEVPAETLMKVLAASECQQYMDVGVEYATADLVHAKRNFVTNAVCNGRIAHALAGKRSVCTKPLPIRSIETPTSRSSLLSELGGSNRHRSKSRRITIVSTREGSEDKPSSEGEAINVTGAMTAIGSIFWHVVIVTCNFASRAGGLESDSNAYIPSDSTAI